MNVSLRTLQCTVVLFAYLPAVACAAPPAAYYAKPTHATVVDAETQQPISGAVVVADWVLDAAGGGDRVMEWEVTEVLTDEHGGFSIPGWGPKVRPAFAELTERDPEMVIFKSGYEPRYLSNKVTTHPSQESVRVSEWDGKTIELKPFRGTPERRAQELGLLVGHCISLRTSAPSLSFTKLYDELAQEIPGLGSAGRALLIRAEGLRPGGH